MSDSTPNNAEISQRFQQAAGPTEQNIWLQMGDCTLHCQSNSAALMAQLQQYFTPFLCEAQPADISLSLLEAAVPPLNLDFSDWKREPGKSGRKDAIADLADGRLVQKVRTGMLFLQNSDHPIAIGPCCDNDNQVINFINAQAMNWLQQRGWLICHSAAVCTDLYGLAICGFSGGGKSTLMLKLMDADKVKFVSNDRLFIKNLQGQTQARGIAKLPRINPGTALHNPMLKPLLPPLKQQQLAALSTDKLWELEDKYDVILDQIYGPGCIQLQTPLNAILILNWDRNSSEPTRIAPVDINQRQDLLPALAKSPGPFYQDAEGSFLNEPNIAPNHDYLATLANVEVLEASGGIDFDSARQQLWQRMGLT